MNQVPDSAQPTISIEIDLHNPGQFFACCGLLESAYRVWGIASLGWFDKNHFFLHVPDRSKDEVDREIIALLQETTFTAEKEEDSGSPIIVNLGEHGELRVDWWLKLVHGASLRTWGRGTSYDLLTSLCDKSRKAKDLASGFGLTEKMTSRLSVDPRSSWTALDAGFSPNDQNFTVATYPLVEFMAGIGLQRYRPVLHERRWSYAAWCLPLPSPLIPTARYILPPTKTHVYYFELAQRGQMTRYFTYSIEGEQ